MQRVQQHNDDPDRVVETFSEKDRDYQTIQRLGAIVILENINGGTSSLFLQSFFVYRWDGYNITRTLPPIACGGKFLRKRHRTTPFDPWDRHTFPQLTRNLFPVLSAVSALVMNATFFPQ